MFDSVHEKIIRAIVVCAILSTTTAWTKQQVIKADDNSGITATVIMPLEDVPPTGAFPVQVTINNPTKSGASWRVMVSNKRWNTGSWNAFREFSVPAGESRTVLLMHLLGSSTESSTGYTNMDFLGSPRLEQVSFNTPNIPNNASAFFAVSEDLKPSRRLLETRLEEANKAAGGSSGGSRRGGSGDNDRVFFGTDVELSQLPADWRALSGVKGLLLSDTEWSKLSPEVAAAVRQWVAMGGKLIVASQPPDKVRPFPMGVSVMSSDSRDSSESSESKLINSSPTNPTTVSASEVLATTGETPVAPHGRYGDGQFQTVAWNGKEVPADVLDPLVMDYKPLLLDSATNPSSWPLLKALGTLEPNRTLVFLFLLGFGLLAGPVNLFLLAPAHRRARLFWTTPLIALGGSAFLLLAILLQDGTGGEGKRLALVRLLPDVHESIIIQEQASKSGLLLGRAFDLSEKTLIVPLRVDEVRKRNYTATGDWMSGDWFLSRTIQAQRLMAVRPTSAEVTLVDRGADDAPEIISSIPGTLKRLCVQSKPGDWWEAENVRTGERVTMKPLPDHEKTLREMTAEMTNAMRVRAHKSMFDSSHNFLAELDRAGEEPIPTLPSIHWKTDIVLYTGQLTLAIKKETTDEHR